MAARPRTPRTPKNARATHDAQLVALDSLKPYPGNARTHDLGVIRESLRVNGQYRPVVVRASTRHVLAGNGTVQAAREEGWTEVWATFVDCDAKAARRINLVDNRANDLAGWDEGVLAAQLGELPGAEGTGWSETELVSFMAKVDGPGEDTEPGEPPAEPRTQPGDLWVLGEHRLLCGDSRDHAALDGAYARAEVGCLLTDPPYGIGLETDYSSMTGSARVLGRSGLKVTKGTSYPRVIGDDEPFDASPFAHYFAKVREQFWFGADYYRRTLSDADRDGSWLVWDKRKDTQAEAFGAEFELIWSRRPHKRRTLRHDWFGFLSSENGCDARSRAHPTQKPVTLLEDILKQWAPAGCIVADPFAGSGSTLIACENLSRRCYAMEIDPGYCDVIVDRWERHTGQKATRAS